MRVYLDSVIVLYLVEQPARFGVAAEALVNSFAPFDLVSSDLVRMEAFILPRSNNDSALLTDFDLYFATQVSEFVALDWPVLDRAASLRAAHAKLKTPDAIHLAAALHSGCGLFLTNDPDCKVVTGIRVELM
jgi:uncharacterized protein